MREPLRVLDLYSGAGVIWNKLGQEFELAAYTPVDIKARLPACIPMKVDARSVRAFDLARLMSLIWTAMVTAGKSRKAFRRIKSRTAVFITCGSRPGK